jgi:hypothetical protein
MNVQKQFTVLFYAIGHWPGEKAVGFVQVHSLDGYIDSSVIYPSRRNNEPKEYH